VPTYKIERPNQKPRIVDAPNKAAARAHVAKSEISVSVIGATEAFRLAQDPDISLEVAGEEAPLAQEPEPPLSAGQAGAGQDADEQGNNLRDADEDDTK
jgi:hypothetical protein